MKKELAGSKVLTNITLLFAQVRRQRGKQHHLSKL